MTAYRECLELYKLDDYLDLDIICDAELDGMDENNISRAAEYNWLWNRQGAKAAERAEDAEDAEVALGTFFEFGDSFVECAKMAYSYPNRKSSRDNFYQLNVGDERINLGPRGITTPFIHLMLCFRNYYPSPPASADFNRRLQEEPELLGDTLLTIVRPARQTQP
jgi:hypothetical protein